MAAVRIPVVDLSAFREITEAAPSSDGRGGDEARRAATKALCEVCHQLGFVYVKGACPLPSSNKETLRHIGAPWLLEVQECIKEVLNFSCRHPPTSVSHRGYSAPGVEMVYSIEDRQSSGGSGGADGNAAPGECETLRKAQDIKENYEVGSEEDSVHENIWLPEQTLPGYKKFATELFWELDAAAKRIHAAFAAGLGLEREDASRWLGLHSEHNNQLRSLHYPYIESETLQRQVVGRMPAHQEWLLFTLDFQDDAGGLEIQDRRSSGTFMPVPPMPGTCVLNVGDMLQRFSNGYIPSALHRVGLPPRRNEFGMTSARHCIIYYYAPDDEVVVQPLATCVTKERPDGYEPVGFAKYGEWLSKHM